MIRSSIALAVGAPALPAVSAHSEVGLASLPTEAGSVEISRSAGETLGSCVALNLAHTGDGAAPVSTPLGDGELWESSTVGLPGADGVDAADLDGDGDLDLVAVGNSLSWFENADGKGSDWVEHALGDAMVDESDVRAGDIDGDGDIDFAVVEHESYYSADIGWWENVRGDGTEFVRNDIGYLIQVVSVDLADMDRDGDLDVVTASGEHLDGQGVVRWWENEDGQGGGWRVRPVDAPDGYTFVRAADLDRDGDLDLVSTSGDFGKWMSWNENASGDGEEWGGTSLVASGAWFTSVEAGDFDGDGDLDLVGGNIDGYSGSGDLRWWKNLDGEGHAWSETVLEPVFWSRHASAADLDSDNDLDILAVGDFAAGLKWYENVAGDGSRFVSKFIDPTVVLPDRVITADVDTDGDPDVIVAAAVIEVWRNQTLSERLCAPGEYVPGERVQLVASPNPGSGVSGWSGTSDDESTARINQLIMPDFETIAEVDYLAGCFTLSTDRTGEGTPPKSNPVSSPGCELGEFVVGDRFGLRAKAAAGWEVQGWIGTVDDSKRDWMNEAVMPAGDATVSVSYGDACDPLVLGRQGEGATPLVEPESSIGCDSGSYLGGEVVELTARSQVGWRVERWVGTDDDTSPLETNTATISEAPMRVGVEYVPDGDR